MTEKFFVVMEVGWDYNDMNYFRPHSGGYSGAVAVFKEEEKAELFCNEKNLEYVQNRFQPTEHMSKWGPTRLAEYQSEGDGIESVLSEEGIQFLRDLDMDVDDDWTIQHLTEEQTRMIVGCLVNPFYEVVEVTQ